MPHRSVRPLPPIPPLPDIDQKASNAQQHPLESQHADLIRSLLKAFQTASAEHFPSYTIGVYPADHDAAVALLLVANKYSPQNFWNGRWRSTYLLDPAAGSLRGTVKADVHYYEDGNVRMSTSKTLELGGGGADVAADALVREIAKAENKLQEDLNRSFVTLAEGSFKGLRRQLPVTRQRVEWEKIGGYRVCCLWRPVGERAMLMDMFSWVRILEEAAPNDFVVRKMGGRTFHVCYLGLEPAEVPFPMSTGVR
jgi:hypothetical protein